MEILICAATSTEKRACLKGLKNSGFENQFQVLGTGIGLEQAGKSLSQYLSQGNNPDLIISSGFAGAVTEDLRLHSWVIAENIFRESGERIKIDLPRNIPEAIKCSMISLPYLFALDKIGQLPYGLPTQRLAIDMETAALAKIAICYQTSFLVLRLITDTPAEPLPQLIYKIEEHYQHRGRVRASRLILDIFGNITEIIGMHKRMSVCSKLLSAGWEKYAPAILNMPH